MKKENYSTFLNNIPTGTWVHHIEKKPSLGGIYARAAGVGGFVYSKWYNYVFLKLPSGNLVKLSKYCVCVNGFSSNKDYHIIRVKKAGINRLLGKRPTVRGVAMNPVDHPHGGGEGKKSKPVKQKTPWGKRAKFVKTVKKKEYVKIPL
jgi:large subunit ribosomal protein L2